MKSSLVNIPDFQAVAAMSRNRVIGRGNAIPWHLPEDFKWFKQLTTEHCLLMGRKTFESIGRPLPNRTTFVLSKTVSTIPGCNVVSSLEQITIPEGKTLFLCGGGEIYRQYLGLCSDLYLTLVKREVEGDFFFPPFEHLFELKETIREETDFKILHWHRLSGV